MRQRTLRNSVTIAGVGVHSGRKVQLTMLPAPSGSGVVFERVDLPGHPSLRIAPEKVSNTQLATRLHDGHCSVSTVEHLLAALSARGIDNVRVQLDAEEVPIMDGSSAPFMLALEDAGIATLPAAKKFLKVTESVEVRDGKKFARISPADIPIISIELSYDHPMFVGHLNANMLVSASEFAKNFARARTYGFMAEVEYLRNRDLGKGGSLSNAVVMDNYRVLNPEGLRYEDEMARHKALDALGDLYVLGHMFIGRFEAYMPGHGINNALLRKLLESTHAYEWITLEQHDALAPKFDLETAFA